MKIIRLIFIVMTLNLFQSGMAEEFNGKVLMRVNGHEYLRDDLLGRFLINEWNNSRNSFYDGITLGKIKKLKYKTVSGSPDEVKLYLTIERTKFCLFRICGYIDIEDIIITLRKAITREGWVLVTEDVEVGDIDIQFDNSGLWILNDLFDLVSNLVFDLFFELPTWIYEQFQGYLVKIKLEDFTTQPVAFPIIPLKTFSESGHSITVQDTLTEIEDLINSFPLEITFDYESNYVINNVLTGAFTNYDGLVIKIELMPGYGNDLTQYMSGNPTIISNPVLERCGFGMKNDDYPLIDVNNTMTWEEEIEEVHHIIRDDLDLTDIRIEASWKWVVGTVPEINPDNIPNFPTITDSDIEDYIEYIDNLEDSDNFHIGWSWLDKVIDDAINKQLRPLVTVGESLAGDTPLYVDSDGSLKYIVPGEPRGTRADESIGVSEAVFKYWLELYTRAVVRRYKDRVDFWEADCELNAARYVESFDWWRVGSAWHDDSEGGFQDQIAALLYNIIHEEDNLISGIGQSEVQVIQAMHVLDMARRIDQWQNYYDIIGVQFYPNEMFAYPVLGYMIGETVFSVKRALDVLGLDKPVWVLETMYPVTNDEFINGLEEANPDTMQNFKQNIMYRSTDRQKQFIKEAIYTSAKYGAEVFDYFRLITPFNHDEGEGTGNTHSWVNLYGGLLRLNDESNSIDYLPAFNTFHDEFDANSPLDWVTLRTQYLELEDLDGTLSVDGVVSGLPSGETRRLYETQTYTAHTDNEWLLRPSNQDPVKHYQWNNSDSEIKIKHTFTPNNEYLKTQTAKYIDQKKVSFQVDILGYTNDDLTHLIEVKDPWYITASKTQPNSFVALVDTNIYSIFLNQNIDFDETKPIYCLKTPEWTVNTDGLFIFSHWAPHADIDYGNGVDLPSYDLVTDVVFKNANAVVLAVYLPASEFPNYTLTVEVGDVFSIPAGIEIQFTEGFTIDIKGSLFIAGTANAPVSFMGSGREPEFENGNLIRPPNPLDVFISIDGQAGDIEMNHVSFENTYCAIDIDDGYSNEIVLSHVAISNTNIAVAIGRTNNARIIISESHIFNSHNGIVFDDGFSYEDQETNILLYKTAIGNIEDYGVFLFQESNYSNSTLNLGILNCTFYDINVQGTNGAACYINNAAGSDWGEVHLSIVNTIFSDALLVNGWVNTTIDGEYNLYHNPNYGVPINSSGSPIAEITSDPLFVNSSNNDVHLQVGSPAIDAGFFAVSIPGFPEYYFLFDPDETMPDIGAYYYIIDFDEFNLTISGVVGGHPTISWNVVNLPDGLEIDAFEVYSYSEFDQTPVYFNETTGYSIIDERFIIAYIEQTDTGRRVKLMKMEKQPEQTFRIKQYWTVKVRDTNNHLSNFSEADYAWVEIGGIVWKVANTIIPKDYELNASFPNPFNPSVTIPFALPLESDVSIDIYNVMGQRVRSLQSANIKAGFHSVQWNSLTDSGRKVPSGMYIVRMNAKSTHEKKMFQKSQKIVLLK
mgnify:CR=1 FL=1